MGARLRAQAIGNGERTLRLSACVAALLTLAACLPLARPVIKIGLVAPFEGRYRDIGYEVIYAVRLAVREANARGGAAGHSVELVALDDGGEPAQAVEQANKLATDPLVVAVLGHWLDTTTVAAAPAYAEAGLPLLATTGQALPFGTLRVWPSEAAAEAALPPGSTRCPPPCGWVDGAAWLVSVSVGDPNAAPAGPAVWAFPQFAVLAARAAEGVSMPLPAPLPADSTDPAFAERYRANSNGVEPRAYAVLAYDATNVLLTALAAGAPTRPSMAEALRALTVNGVSGEVGFDEAGTWQGSVWVYLWRDGILEMNP